MAITLEALPDRDSAYPFPPTLDNRFPVREGCRPRPKEPQEMLAAKIIKIFLFLFCISNSSEKYISG